MIIDLKLHQELPCIDYRRQNALEACILLNLQLHDHDAGQILEYVED